MSIQSIGANAQLGAQITGAAKSDSAATHPDHSITPSSNTASNPTPTPEQVNKAINDLNKSIQANTPSIEFSTDDTSKRLVVKVVDQQTKQVLMQFPSEEVIDMSKSLDKLQGLLIKLKA